MMNVSRHGFSLFLLIATSALAADPVSYTVDQCQEFVDYVRKEVRSTDCDSLTKESRASLSGPKRGFEFENFQGVYSTFCKGPNKSVKDVQTEERFSHGRRGIPGATQGSAKVLSAEEFLPLSRASFVENPVMQEKIAKIYARISEESRVTFASASKAAARMDGKYRESLKKARANFWEAVSREMLGGGCLEAHPKVHQALCSANESMIGDCRAKVDSMKTSEILQAVSRIQVASAGEKTPTTALRTDEKFKGNRAPAIAPGSAPSSVPIEESKDVREIRD